MENNGILQELLLTLSSLTNIQSWARERLVGCWHSYQLGCEILLWHFIIKKKWSEGGKSVIWHKRIFHSVVKVNCNRKELFYGIFRSTNTTKSWFKYSKAATLGNTLHYIKFQLKIRSLILHQNSNIRSLNPFSSYSTDKIVHKLVIYWVINIGLL